VTRLLLFDIDGTLISSGGAGGRAMARAFQEVFGFSNGLGSISMAGRTDAWIVAQMAAEHGLEYDADKFRLFHDTYIRHLSTEILAPRADKGVLPGVRELLDILVARSDTHLALLTGNFQKGAEIKLQFFDLWRYFATGAFGDDSHDRNGLLWKAMANVEAAGGAAVRPSEVLVIGDTPLDIAVAVAGGARSLGVATGNYDAEALRASGADAVVPDLSDPEPVLAMLKA
jgi:phosphoglycolate phosphatase